MARKTQRKAAHPCLVVSTSADVTSSCCYTGDEALELALFSCFFHCCDKIPNKNTESLAHSWRGCSRSWWQGAVAGIWDNLAILRCGQKETNGIGPCPFLSKDLLELGLG